jgi:hypothetical protein
MLKGHYNDAGMPMHVMGAQIMPVSMQRLQLRCQKNNRSDAADILEWAMCTEEHAQSEAF